MTEFITVRDIARLDAITAAAAGDELAIRDVSTDRINKIAKSDLITTANQKSVTGAGTAYTLTATSAAINLGTTDPAIVLDAAGTYLLVGTAVINYEGATFATSRSITLKLRRTNNTAGDVTGGSVVVPTGVTTTLTQPLATASVLGVYTTANDDDALTLFADVSVVPTAGAVTVTAAQIFAIRLQV